MDNAELYSELTNIVDHVLDELSGCPFDPDVPSTSPQARRIVNKLLEWMEENGIDISYVGRYRKINHYQMDEEVENE